MHSFPLELRVLKNFEEKDSEDYLLLSGILHFAFCKRRWALIHIEQQWSENSLTFSGRLMHKNADNPHLTECRGDIIITHAMPLVSHSLKVYGVADVVEFQRSDTGVELQKYSGLWNVIPVEYKSGKKNSFGSDEVQLCCQAMCLEEMFETTIQHGFLYYGKTRHRFEVKFDNDLRNRVTSLVAEMYRLFEEGITPPAVYQKHCDNCSLVDICLPQLSSKKHAVDSYLESAILR